MTARNFFLASSPLLEEAEVAALEERRPGEMQTEGGRLGEKKLFSKKGRDPLQKGEENIEIEVILFIL